jgi:pimeloyl-ACP methyl ester carboxylesterase
MTVDEALLRSAIRRPRPPRWPSPWPEDRGGHVWAKDREAVTSDGARIRYTVRGREDGPWVVLLSGYLCPDNFWRGLGRSLMERHRVVVLNYRSVGASTHPGEGARPLTDDDYTIPRLAEDVATVLDAEGARDAVAVGHSMGCQVALQLWRARPDLTGGLVLVTGPFASPLHTFYGSRLGARVFPHARRGLSALPRPVLDGLLKSPRLSIAVPVARLIRALGPHTPAEGMLDYLHHLGEVDPAVALRLAHGMHAFDASPWLHEVDVPTLVVVGSRDTFSPPEVGERLIERVAPSELVTVDGGTHAALLEHPGEIHDAVADFVHRRLGGPTWRPSPERRAVSSPRGWEDDDGRVSA